MNYVELHIGDYDKATAHLTACEDGVYGRLLRRYYDTEAPLPLDLKALQRLVRARSRDEKEAVETVLDEFFQKRDDGWHHPRCDEEIARFQETQDEREEKKQHETERKRRYRQRRRELFAELREHGIVPPFETPIEELEATLSRVLSQGTDTGTGRGRSRKGTAIQTPDTSNTSVGSTEASPERLTALAREACAAMHRLGIVRFNPSHPDLLAAFAEGVTLQAIVDTAGEALRTEGVENPFLWTIGTARSRHVEGPREITGATHANRSTGRKLSAVEQVERNILERRAREGQQRDGEDRPAIEGAYVAGSP